MTEFTEYAESIRREEGKPIVVDLSKGSDPADVLRAATAAAMPHLPESLRAEAKRDMERAIDRDRATQEMLGGAFAALRGRRA
jgi:hypothetical protein